MNWGLRDYKLEPLVWGGDEACEHEWGDAVSGDPRGGSGPKAKEDGNTYARAVERGSWCRLCGAWRGSLGLEPTIDLYLQHMVEIMREIGRVLRPEGTVWFNVGDSYATGQGKVGKCPGGGRQGENWKGAMTQPNRMPQVGLKPKDLSMIPARLALALQADGWWLRSQIVWAKGLSFCESYSGSVMPESCRDRPTSAYEMVYLLTKSARYYYDQETVREEGKLASLQRYKYAFSGTGNDGPKQSVLAPEGMRNIAPGRNLRNVWAINPKPYPAAHFATFPPTLVEPCIKAGTSEKGCCPKCGAPWERTVKRKHWGTLAPKDLALGKTRNEFGGQTKWASYVPPETIGWRPTCSCNAEDPVPCTVLDPFLGSGTTSAVAARLGRNSVGYELQADYLPLIEDRLRKEQLDLFDKREVEIVRRGTD